MSKRRVVLESPYKANSVVYTDYARACLRDSIDRGEAPIASHLLHTQVLDDQVPAERALGMAAGHAWISVAHALVVYCDYGISEGMQDGIALAQALRMPIDYRTLYELEKI